MKKLIKKYQLLKENGCLDINKALELEKELSGKELETLKEFLNE